MKNLVKGMYGRTPAPIAPEIFEKFLGDERPVEGRPADHIAPELDRLQAEYGSSGLLRAPEDLLTLAMNPEVGSAFLKSKYGVS
jgi:pyruvate/oxaloacetate carboxyltransferase